MAEKLKIIPLGGLNEIGKNMTVLEYGKDIIIVDCGLGFPDEEMYGVDLVIADMTYLVKNKDKIRGMFLTHGHEDHIGGIPYAMEQFNCPIHATRLTAGIVQLKLEEHQLQNTVHLFTHEAGEKVKAGCFTVEFIHVNHSIADAVAFAIKTPVGTIVMTGDFKIDATAEDGMIDLARFGALGKEGVLALLCDSTNVERQGYTPSEKTVAANFERQFSGCNKRIIVTTFASNAFRLQSLIATAKKFGRKVAVTGRIIAVFGCGGCRDKGKRPLMGAAAGQYADLTVLTSDNPRTEDPLAIIRDILPGLSGPHLVIPDRREAIFRALDLARPGDTVILCGKGHEITQETGGHRLPMDERQIIAEYINGS